MAHMKLEYKSAALTRGVFLEIFLPTDGWGAEVPFPYRTLYFLPGYSGDSAEIYTYLSMRRQSDLKGVAVVIVNGDNSFYVDHPQRNMNYSTFVGKEVVEMTRKLLPLSHKREDTYLAGVSMGGYGTLLNGMRYADTFGRIAAMSPAIDTYEVHENQPDAGFSIELLDNIFGSREEFLAGDTNLTKTYLDAFEKKELMPEVYVTCGRQDRLVYEQDKRFAEELQKAGVPIVYQESDGDHETDFWEGKMDAVFSFLTGIPEGSRNKIVLP